MIATPVPFFAIVPTTQHHTGNAIHSSQDIYHSHYSRQWGGPSLQLSPGAASRLTRLQLPTAPAPGRRRRRLLPFLLPRGEPQVANPTDLTIRFCKITHKDLPFAPAPPSLAPGRPARSTKCPSLLPGLARRNAGWGCFVSPLAQCKDLGNLKPYFGYSPARSCHFTKLARWEK